MTLKRLFLASGSVLVLTAAGALADNNEAWLEQVGNANSALIDQDDGEGNKAGASGNAAFQRNENSSTGNTLTITQNGNDNAVGLDMPAGQRGITQRNQSSPGNTASILQDSSGNTIGSMLQFVRTASSSGNQLTVTQQGGDGNAIGRIAQETSGGGTAGNTASITQDGTDNSIGLARQGANFAGTQGGNDMTLNQTGERNMIGTARQLGVGNEMTAVFTGNENGDDGGDGIINAFGSGMGTFADDVGVSQGDLTQTGADNFIDILVQANRTYFGIAQTGDRNRVDPLTITGTRNELGILQQGDDNTVSISDIATFGNNIGIRQFQDGNTANVSVAASGGGNLFGILQDGMTNIAVIDIDGASNGIDNPFASLTGPAATIAGIAGWERGMVKQLGDVNSASLTVVGSDNEFGTLQDGFNNELTSAQTGIGNVVAVAQVGNGNLSDTTQNGSGNNAGIMQ